MILFTKKEVPNTEEMNSFYEQLVKMKSRRKNFNIVKVMNKVYPNYKFPNE